MGPRRASLLRSPMIFGAMSGFSRTRPLLRRQVSPFLRWPFRSRLNLCTLGPTIRSIWRIRCRAKWRLPRSSNLRCWMRPARFFGRLTCGGRSSRPRHSSIGCWYVLRRLANLRGTRQLVPQPTPFPSSCRSSIVGATPLSIPFFAPGLGPRFKI